MELGIWHSIIIGAVHHTAPIKTRYVQFARILLHWTQLFFASWVG